MEIFWVERKDFGAEKTKFGELQEPICHFVPQFPFSGARVTLF